MMNRLYRPMSKSDEVVLNSTEMVNVGKGILSMASDGYSATSLGNGWHIHQPDPEVLGKEVTDHFYMTNARTGQQLQIKLDIKNPFPREVIPFNGQFDTLSDPMGFVFTCADDAPMLHWSVLNQETLKLDTRLHYLKVGDYMVRADKVLDLAKEPLSRKSTMVIDDRVAPITTSSAYAMVIQYKAVVETLEQTTSE